MLIFARINEGFTAEEAIKLEGNKGSAELIGQTEALVGSTRTIEVEKPLEPGRYMMMSRLKRGEGPARTGPSRFRFSSGASGRRATCRSRAASSGR